MKSLIKFPLEKEGYILVEVEQPDSTGGSVKPLRSAEVIERASVKFEQALENVRPAANAIIATLRGLKDPPDDIEVSFGLKMNAEAGAIIASSKIEANYAVTLKWQGCKPAGNAG